MATATLKLGSTGTNVKKVQTALNVFSTVKGEPSGTFDGYTADAVRAWQRNAEREVTGELSGDDVKAILDGVQYPEPEATAEPVTEPEVPASGTKVTDPSGTTPPASK